MPKTMAGVTHNISLRRGPSAPTVGGRYKAAAVSSRVRPLQFFHGTFRAWRSLGDDFLQVKNESGFGLKAWFGAAPRENRPVADSSQGSSCRGLRSAAG